MSQAMLMRIIALEKRMERLESVIDAHFHAHEPSFETEEILHITPESPSPLELAVENPTFFWLEQHGASWWRVFGPNGEVTEKGLRKHEAQALADDLNEQAVSQAG